MLSSGPSIFFQNREQRMNRPWKARIVMAHGYPTQETAHRRGKTKSRPLTLATSTAAGALMLLRPADWPAPLRWAYLTAPGVLVSTGSTLLLLGKAHAEPPRSTDTAGRNAREVLPAAAHRSPPSAVRTVVGPGNGDHRISSVVVAGRCRGRKMVTPLRPRPPATVDGGRHRPDHACRRPGREFRLPRFR